MNFKCLSIAAVLGAMTFSYSHAEIGPQRGDDIITSVLRCQSHGIKVKNCLPTQGPVSPEFTLTINILAKCESVGAPLVACYTLIDSARRCQTHKAALSSCLGTSYHPNLALGALLDSLVRCDFNQISFNKCFNLGQ